MTASQEFWWLAPLISFLGLMAVVWFGWGQHRLKAFRLRRPFDAVLTHGADKPDEFCELHVPADSEVMIQVRIRPRTAYKQLEMVFGFFGDTSKRPEPRRVLNTFIKRGINREPSVDSNPNHYIDQDGHYHITTPTERTPEHTYVMGYIVQTRDPGRYPVLLKIVTESGEANPYSDLFVRVI
jgi:hypothetical protein